MRCVLPREVNESLDELAAFEGRVAELVEALGGESARLCLVAL
jgi:hypothetical protein